MAQHRARFRLARRAAGVARDDARRSSGLTRAPIAEDILVLEHAARDDDVRALATTRAAVERLWDVCQVPDYRKIAPATHAELAVTLYGFLMREGRIPVDWFAQPGGAGRPYRWRDRYALEPDRAYPDLDLRGQPSGLARRSRALAGGHARRRGQAFRCAARASHRAVRRSPHQRVDAAVAREHDIGNRNQENRRSGGRGPRDRPARRLPLRRRRLGRRLGSQGAAGRRAKALAGEIDARATRLAQAPDEQFVLASDGTIRWIGRRGRQARSPARTCCARACASSPTSSLPALRATRCRRGSTSGSRRISKSCSGRCSRSPPPRTSPASRAASPSSWSRRSACWSGRRSRKRSRASTSRRAPPCANTACASAPTTSICRRCSSRRRARSRRSSGRSRTSSAGRQGPRRAAAARRQRAHLDPGRQGDAEGALPHHRLSGVRRARDPRRYSGAARRSDPARRSPGARARPGAKPPGAVDGSGFTVTGAMTSLTGASGEDFASILRSLGYRMERRPKPPEAEQPTGGRPAAGRRCSRPSVEAPAEQTPATPMRHRRQPQTRPMRAGVEAAAVAESAAEAELMPTATASRRRSRSAAAEVVAAEQPMRRSSRQPEAAAARSAPPSRR